VDLAVLGLELDSMVLRVFSNLNDSMFLLKRTQTVPLTLSSKLWLSHESLEHLTDWETNREDTQQVNNCIKLHWKIEAYISCIYSESKFLFQVVTVHSSVK